MLLTTLLLAGTVAAPLSLTSSDGAGLKLVSLDADAVCSGPVCFTQLGLSFENPEDRVIEGQFQIALPPGASPSRTRTRRFSICGRPTRGKTYADVDDDNMCP